MKSRSKQLKVTTKQLTPGISPLRLSFLIFNFYFSIFNCAASAQLVKSVDTVGMTVSDMDRSVEFFSKVLAFEKVSDIEVAGSEYERLEGVFGARMRIVRMRLGDEIIEMTEYVGPQGRRVPPAPRGK